VIAKRLVALAVALGLVAVSLAIRAAVLDDDGDGTGGSDGGDGPLHLTCVTELAEACRAVADGSGGRVRVTVEPAGTTAARIVAAADAAALGADGWLTLAPWPDIVRDRRSRVPADPVLGDTSAPIARSPLSIAMRRDRADVLARACGGAIDWPCIGEHAGRPWADVGGQPQWQDVVPAHAHPVDTASGLLVLGQAAGQYLATPERPIEQIAGNELNDEAFAGWFQQLETSIPSSAFESPPTPFDRWVQTGRVVYSLVGGLEAEMGPRIGGSGALNDDVTVLYPAPVASADVVFAPVAGGNEDLADLVRGDDAVRALGAAGWIVPGRDPIDGAGGVALPDGTGLPPAGTLDALQGYWQEQVR
jgi:hypothetical protein